MSERSKIGVLTMHRVVNYGSFLQTYATQEIINSLGYECEIIDYIYPNQWHYQHGLNHRSLKSRLIEKLCFLKITSYQRKQCKINKSIKDYLKLSIKYDSIQKICNQPPKYDVYVTGSDQTWNTKHTKGDAVFLLSFAPENAKKISFSSSIAQHEIEGLYKSDFVKYLSKYNSISVRENESVFLIKELVDKDATVTLDPTLLIDKMQWVEFSKTKINEFRNRKYILFYMLSYSFEPRPYIYDLLKELQDKTEYTVLSFTKIPTRYKIKYEFIGDIGIESFIHSFESASFVVTSSFHGTAFALNFGIPLYSITGNINSEDRRQISLLQKLDVINCAAPIGRSFHEIDPNYDTKVLQKKLIAFRKKSINYLLEALKL